MGSRIRSAVPADRRLVDVDDLLHVLHAIYAVMRTRQRARIDQLLPERLVENVADERALAGTGRARNRHEGAERKRDVHGLEIVLARSVNGQRLAVPWPPLPRRRNDPLARQVQPGRRRLGLGNVVYRSLLANFSTVVTRGWPHFHDVVGGTNRVLVVLDDDDGVADVAEPFNRRDHLDVVFWMKTDAGFVEDVEHAHQPRPDLRGQPDPLRLAARQRAGAAIEPQIVEPDTQEQFEPSSNFIQELPPASAAASRFDCAEEFVKLVEMQLAEIVDAAARIEQQPGCANPRAVAVRTRALDHDLVEPRLHARVGLAALAIVSIPPLDSTRDPVEPDFTSFLIGAAHLGIRRRHD